MVAVKLHATPAVLQRDGPLIRIAISAPQFEIAQGRRIGLDFPEPMTIGGLIDTGASLTVVNPQVAQRCRLSHTGFATIFAAGSSGQYPEYAAAISFPNHELKGFELIRVVACPIVGQRLFACLIGRDILRKWMLTYDGHSGETTIKD